MKQFEFKLLAIESILPNPKRVRYHIPQKDLIELADSIKEYGLLQPIIVGITSAGFQLIAGERRLRAAKIAGFSEIPAMVGEAASVDLLLLYLEENYRRTKLSLLERAKLIKQLEDNHDMRPADIAKRLHVNTEEIEELRKVLDLPLIIHEAYLDNKLTEEQLLLFTREKDPLKSFYETKS